jgi:hypothetical protein|tara:strand:+ start:154 stop:330 length:177 start_codon:yes stop_codon:yes gene_type:complete
MLTLCLPQQINGPGFTRNPLILLVDVRGLEPLTSWVRSNQEEDGKSQENPDKTEKLGG